MTRQHGFGWLTRRLVLSPRDRLSTIGVIGLAIAFLTVLLLATIAVPHVASKQKQREAARTPSISDSRSAARTAKLLSLEPALTSSGSQWSSHSIDRQVYASRDGGGEQHIPGIARVPKPTDYYASPALVDLIKHDPVVRALYADRHLAGTIGSAGLLQPHELRSIEAMPPGSSLLYAVTGFGEARGNVPDRAAANLDISVATAAVISVWAPAFVLLVVCSRFASRARATRARALRLQGLSIRAVRLLMGLEVAMVALPSAIVGAALYLVLIRVVTRLPGTAFGFYSSDASMPWLVLLAAAVAISVAASLSAAYSLPMEVEEPVAIRRRRPRTVVTVGLGLLIVGISYLVLLPVMSGVTSYAPLGIWPSITCVLLGVAVAGPHLVMIGSSRAAPMTRRAGSLVGLRLNSWRITTAMRLGTLGAVLVIVMLGMVGFVNVLSGGSASTWSDALHHGGTTPVSVNDLTGQLTRGDITPVARNHAVVEQASSPVVAGKKHRRQHVIFASCADLSGLVGRPVHGCSPQGAWIQTGDRTVQRHRAVGKLVVGPKNQIPLPDDSRVVNLAGGPAGLDGAVLLPAGVATVAAVESPSFQLTVDSKRIDEALATISGSSATSQFQVGRTSAALRLREHRAQYEWLVVGVVAGTICGALTMLAAVLGEREERRRRFDGMREVGASGRDLVIAHYWATAWPTLVLGCGGVAVGWLVSHEMAQFDGRAHVPGMLYALSIAGVFLVAFGTATASVGDPLRRG